MQVQFHLLISNNYFKEALAVECAFYFKTGNLMIVIPPKNAAEEMAKYLCSAVLCLYFVKAVCIPTVSGVLIPCNYANDTLMRCNCKFIKQQG